jgi:ubiquitin-protein ligase E3 C
LLLLTHLYNHYLLITPDDEFFDTANSNPLSLDEVLDLAGIWRDLAYHAYLNGVAPEGTKPVKGVGTEDERSLMTRGVTRIVERKWACVSTQVVFRADY